MSAPGTRHAVLFIFFNRADCAERSFAAIRAARPARLYLATDAPRPQVPDDEARCRQTRALVERMVDWPCEVRRDFAGENLGATRRIESALTWLFREEECALVFEEDCVPDATFFPFCDELLERYAGEPKVVLISGCQFVPGGWAGREAASYSFARLTQIWGWASWRRAWAHHDPTMQDWPAARRSGLLKKIFPAYYPHRRYWRRRFDACHRGDLAVWDYRWTFGRWLHDQVGIVPAQNLVSYIGFRDDALHTRGPHPAAALPTKAMTFPLKHPASLAADPRLDDATARILFYEGGYFPWLEYQWKKNILLRP